MKQKRERCEKCGKDAVFFDLNMQLWLCEECVNKGYKDLNIDEFIKKHPEAGYVSTADVVSEAVRLRIQELKEKYPSKS